MSLKIKKVNKSYFCKLSVEMLDQNRLMTPRFEESKGKFHQSKGSSEDSNSEEEHKAFAHLNKETNFIENTESSMSDLNSREHQNSSRVHNPQIVSIGTSFSYFCI